MVITVPLNAKVTATFVNDSTLPHSALIVGYRKWLPAKAPEPAFRCCPNRGLNGAEKWVAVTTFFFTANKVDVC